MLKSRILVFILMLGSSAFGAEELPPWTIFTWGNPVQFVVSARPLKSGYYEFFAQWGGSPIKERLVVRSADRTRDINLERAQTRGVEWFKALKSVFSSEAVNPRGLLYVVDSRAGTLVFHTESFGPNAGLLVFDSKGMQEPIRTFEDSMGNPMLIALEETYFERLSVTAPEQNSDAKVPDWGVVFLRLSDNFTIFVKTPSDSLSQPEFLGGYRGDLKRLKVRIVPSRGMITIFEVSDESGNKIGVFERSVVGPRKIYLGDNNFSDDFSRIPVDAQSVGSYIDQSMCRFLHL